MREHPDWAGRKASEARMQEILADAERRVAEAERTGKKKHYTPATKERVEQIIAAAEARVLARENATTALRRHKYGPEGGDDIPPHDAPVRRGPHVPPPEPGGRGPVITARALLGGHDIVGHPGISPGIQAALAQSVKDGRFSQADLNVFYKNFGTPRIHINYADSDAYRDVYKVFKELKRTERKGSLAKVAHAAKKSGDEAAAEARAVWKENMKHAKHISPEEWQDMKDTAEQQDREREASRSSLRKYLKKIVPRTPEERAAFQKELWEQEKGKRDRRQAVEKAFSLGFEPVSDHGKMSERMRHAAESARAENRRVRGLVRGSGGAEEISPTQPMHHDGNTRIMAGTTEVIGSQPAHEEEIPATIDVVNDAIEKRNGHRQTEIAARIHEQNEQTARALGKEWEADHRHNTEDLAVEMKEYGVRAPGPAESDRQKLGNVNAMKEAPLNRLGKWIASMVVREPVRREPPPQAGRARPDQMPHMFGRKPEPEKSIVDVESLRRDKPWKGDFRADVRERVRKVRDGIEQVRDARQRRKAGGPLEKEDPEGDYKRLFEWVDAARTPEEAEDRAIAAERAAREYGSHGRQWMRQGNHQVLIDKAELILPHVQRERKDQEANKERASNDDVRQKPDEPAENAEPGRTEPERPASKSESAWAREWQDIRDYFRGPPELANFKNAQRGDYKVLVKWMNMAGPDRPQRIKAGFQAANEFWNEYKGESRRIAREDPYQLIQRAEEIIAKERERNPVRWEKK